MPPEGIPWTPHAEILSYEEIIRLTHLFSRLGVDKVRLTGGEPTTRKHIEILIRGLANIDGLRSLALTTNGSTLAQRASTYREAGLSGLNISIDSLQRDRFAEITRRDELPRVLAGLDAALEAGYDFVKVNMVVMAGVNEDEILDMIELTRHRPIHVRFIEFMPFEGNGWKEASIFSYAEMRRCIESKHTLIPLDVEPSAVGKDFAIPGFAGKVGFVTSMTDSFCSTCNRLRLTAEGALKVCLFSGAEVSLRDPMRAGADDLELEAIVRAALDLKWRGHPPMNLLPQVANKSMVAIGG